MAPASRAAVLALWCASATHAFRGKKPGDAPSALEVATALLPSASPSFPAAVTPEVSAGRVTASGHLNAPTPRSRFAMAAATAAAVVASTASSAGVEAFSLFSPPVHPRRGEAAAFAPPGGRLLQRPLSSARRMSTAEGMTVKLVEGADVPAALAHLTNLRRVGVGYGHVVYRATEPATEVDYAIKQVDGGSSAKEAIKMEQTALELLGGGDVVKWIATKSENGKTYFFMEAADGDLRTMLFSKSGREASPELKLRILVDILRGLVKFDKLGWVHRDLNPTNILVFGDCLSTEGCHVKIGDLGQAMDQGALLWQDRSKSVRAGDPVYVAPEVWSGRGDMYKSDVWSAGLIAYELFIGALPAVFRNATRNSDDASQDAALESAVRTEFRIDDDAEFLEFAKTDGQIADLIRRMLQKSASKRASAPKAYAAARELAEARGAIVPEHGRDASQAE